MKKAKLNVKERIEAIKLSTLALAVLICFLYGARYFIKSEKNHTDEEYVGVITDNAIRSIAIEGDFKDRDGNVISHGVEPRKAGEIASDLSQPYAWILGFNNIGASPFGIKGIAQRDLYYTLDENHRGSTIHLTIDTDIQKIAYNEILAGQYGSVTVLDNTTGEILCLASHGPVVFDLLDLNKFFQESNQVPGSQYMPGVRETDPPGSTFKIITSAAALDLKDKGLLDESAFHYYDSGSFFAEGSDYEVKNYGNYAYGQLDLNDALAYSSNTYFANLGTKVSWSALEETASRFLIGEKISIPYLGTLSSNFAYENRSPLYLAFTSYGQGALSLTPLHLTMIASAIANNGVMRQPYIVSSITSNDESYATYVNTPSILAENCVSENVAQRLKEGLRYTAEKSYGFIETAHGVVYAKTGTAECGENRIHTYLLGFTDRYSFCISINDSASRRSSDLYEPAKKLVSYVNYILEQKTQQKGDSDGE